MQRWAERNFRNLRNCKLKADRNAPNSKTSLQALAKNLRDGRDGEKPSRGLS